MKRAELVVAFLGHMWPVFGLPFLLKRMNGVARREHYQCKKDDTWGRLEIPVGPMREYDILNQPLTISSGA